ALQYAALQPDRTLLRAAVPQGLAMTRLRSVSLLTLGLMLTAPLPTAAAATVVVEAGQTHTLTADLVLNGDDVLDIRGTPEQPCVLAGNRYRIRSGPQWTGSLRITHGQIRDLGGLPKRAADGRVAGPGAAAIELKVAGQGRVTIEHCTLDACA